MNRQTPLNEMTLEQLYVVHGETPTRKFVPQRPFGPPKSRDELRPPTPEEQAARHVPAPVYTPTGPESAAATTSASSAVGLRKARLAVPIGVAPTYPDLLLKQPCQDVIELEVDVENLGLVLYPVACGIEEAHPGQPHMARIMAQDSERPDRRLDVFVGWRDQVDDAESSR